jgi:hypothetical protein
MAVTLDNVICLQVYIVAGWPSPHSCPLANPASDLSKGHIGIVSLIVAYRFVAAKIVFPSRHLAMGDMSYQTIQSFNTHITVPCS